MNRSMNEQLVAQRMGCAYWLVPAALGCTLLMANAGGPPVGDDGNQIDSGSFCGGEANPTFINPDTGEGRVGDADGDGIVSFGDIDCFVAALFGEELWRACRGITGGDFVRINDINRDGIVDFHDIDAFIVLMSTL